MSLPRPLAAALLATAALTPTASCALAQVPPSPAPVAPAPPYADVADLVVAKDINPKQRSGGQERLENLINRFCS